MFLQLQGILLPRAPLCTSMTRTSQTHDLINVNFVLCCALLIQLGNQKPPEEVKRPFDHFFSINRATDPPITVKDGRRTDGDAIKSLRQRVRGYGEFIAAAGGFDLDQATTLLPTLILELAHYIPASAVHVVLPYPAIMSFREMLDIPPVFRYNSEEQTFATSHIRKMITLDFLNGLWIGYYSDQRRILGRRSFDPPMRDIRLVARMPHQGTTAATNVKALVDSESRGVDAYGEFTLEGQIREDGLVRMTKRYIQNRGVWLWLGRLTPFGIVGVWGAGHGHFGGYFWIWKQEWCRI
ncbi:hypothetical protein DDE82_000180 [Stemphylium lycopersici]|uniref:Uncharacterized protein n=1 Tax=Stemphylium lycopersici TaxID=183478 RepID=A0A364N5V4_STELY|nr:hypothetical protein DDE82_000180 [Stemphylium lycopersici]RAR12646.1 hypothetical protein DDE83_004043 [Stemphylium lycopersici]